MMTSSFFKLANKPLLIAILALSLNACGEKPTNSQQGQQIAQQTTKKPSDSTQNTQSDATVVSALQTNLKKSGVDLVVKSATATQMQGIYWVMFDDAPPMFTDIKGEYLIQGQIAKIGDKTPIDITSTLQSLLAKELLAKVNPSEMIVYPATSEHQAAIYVFSDPSCHYCQKLHSEIKDITDKGIEVRYLAWPRSDRLIPLTEAIWCSSNRHDALTRAKQGQNITAPTCDNPVKKHMALGHQIGVGGTPAIFTESGQQIGGYLPATELARLAIEYKN